ncbi:DUF4440 domain-containing protein [Gottfriedia sp. NPDC057991]|uniref:nuclear transport factor 2 family protein n=1 Tax=Gottfriedia sp. NPDC057991 TaxID=3346298 RepID=UPI0036DF9ED5
MESLHSLKEHLCMLEERLLKPEIRTSQVELKKLLANEFFEFGSSGRVLYKDQLENGIGTVKMTLSDFEIHPLSDEITLVTYRIFNEVKKQDSLRSSIWKFKDGQWKMYFHQGTPTEF